MFHSRFSGHCFGSAIHTYYGFGGDGFATHAASETIWGERLEVATVKASWTHAHTTVHHVYVDAWAAHTTHSSTDTTHTMCLATHTSEGIAKLRTEKSCKRISSTKEISKNLFSGAHIKLWKTTHITESTSTSRKSRATIHSKILTTNIIISPLLFITQNSICKCNLFENSFCPFFIIGILVWMIFHRKFPKCLFNLLFRRIRIYTQDFIQIFTFEIRFTQWTVSSCSSIIATTSMFLGTSILLSIDVCQRKHVIIFYSTI